MLGCQCTRENMINKLIKLLKSVNLLEKQFNSHDVLSYQADKFNTVRGFLVPLLKDHNALKECLPLSIYELATDHAVPVISLCIQRRPCTTTLSMLKKIRLFNS